jgi:cytidine deaminase
MIEILEMLYDKIYCIPKETETAGIYRHIAGFFYEKGRFFKKTNFITYGLNQYTDEKSPSIHAEHNALINISKKCLKPHKSICLIVLRFSKAKKLGSSKPCYHCLEKLSHEMDKKNLNIKYIYYSDRDGKVLRTTLDKLKNEEMHYSGYYRNKFM